MHKVHGNVGHAQAHARRREVDQDRDRPYGYAAARLSRPSARTTGRKTFIPLRSPWTSERACVANGRAARALKARG